MDREILEQDSCVIYAETDPGRFPVEPLNTLSILVFLAVLIYWIRKVGLKFSRHPLIATVMPILLLGLLAVAIHHAFRIHKVWNTIGMLAIFYAVIMTCVYLWFRIFGKWLIASFFTFMFPVFFWIFFVNIDVPEKITIPVIFAAMSIGILIPALIYCIKSKLKNIELLAVSSFLFTIGMIFRQIDLVSKDFFSHGTHFIWHMFCAVSVFILMKFIYLIDEERAEEIKNNPK